MDRYMFFVSKQLRMNLSIVALFHIAVCAVGSLVSLAWGIASYARTMRNVHEGKARITWIGLALQAVWRTGTMVARIISLLLCASVIHNWFVLAISIHWLGMTVWTIRQKTDLCSTAWEERVYNGVVGVIYCFCFFNVKVTVEVIVISDPLSASFSFCRKDLRDIEQ